MPRHVPDMCRFVPAIFTLENPHFRLYSFVSVENSAAESEPKAVLNFVNSLTFCSASCKVMQAYRVIQAFGVD